MSHHAKNVKQTICPQPNNQQNTTQPQKPTKNSLKKDMHSKQSTITQKPTKQTNPNQLQQKKDITPKQIVKLASVS